MKTKLIIPFVPYLVVSVLHVALQIAGSDWADYRTKQLLMPALALAVVWSLWRVRPYPRPAASLLFVALAASWVGDGAGWFFPSWPTLPTMIAFFGVAHLAYIALFWRAPGLPGVRGVPPWALIYAGWWIATLAVVGPHAGVLLVPLALYGLVLGGTAALSTRLGALVACGGAFFLVSDTLIAFREFMGVPEWIGLAVMPTYELGQGLIVFGVVALLRAASSRAHTVPETAEKPRSVLG